MEIGINSPAEVAVFRQFVITVNINMESRHKEDLKYIKFGREIFIISLETSIDL
jgi:sRNA-binding carbon storage regulator CsrA